MLRTTEGFLQPFLVMSLPQSISAERQLGPRWLGAGLFSFRTAGQLGYTTM